jgi:rhamnogalacturonan endolyase
MKEARLMTSGVMKGQVEHKYDYAAVQFDTPAYGWSSTTQHVGLWMIAASNEYMSGGPTKLELSTHRDATFTDSLTAPAPPVILNVWKGPHYGGTSLVVAPGEEWSKVIGPFLLYPNSGPTPDAMWKDSLTRAAAEAARWPYAWVSSAGYPHKSERAIVSGRIVLSDPLAPSVKMSNLLVGLAHADYSADNDTVDWQKDGKYYQYWVRGDAQGGFVIPNVRPGDYTLHAFADGVLGEYEKTSVSVAAGRLIDLGSLKWTPVRFGRPLWEIGIPDRTAGEFLHGDHYWEWGLYNQYRTDFPNDVQFVIGKSDYHKDWNLMQAPRGPGQATTWTVTFNLPDARHGKATLRLAFAGTEARQLLVSMNDHAVGTVANLMNTGVIHRDADRGYWVQRDVPFDAAAMKAGANVLKLTVPGGNVMNGIEYDYLRLELDEKAVYNAGSPHMP